MHWRQHNNKRRKGKIKHCSKGVTKGTVQNGKCDCVQMDVSSLVTA